MTDEELDEYLTNWGRWSRECKTPSRSFLTRLMAEAGSLPQEEKTVQVDIKKSSSSDSRLARNAGNNLYR